MRVWNWLLAGIVVGLMGVAFADGEAGGAPSPAAAEEPGAQIIPEVNFQSVALEDCVDFLQAACKSFHAVVVRAPGSSGDYPLITLKLKKVSVNEIMQVLENAYPGITPNQVGSVLCLNVQEPEAGNPERQVGVHVYPLNGVVQNQVQAGIDDPKKALDHVLSLIKATLTQVARVGHEPVLQVHEETQTLIFKGNASERAALEGALVALGDESLKPAAAPAPSPEAARSDLEVQKAVAEGLVDDLKKKLDSATIKVEEAQKSLQEISLENERLKIRLEMLQKKEDPGAKNEHNAPKE